MKNIRIYTASKYGKEEYSLVEKDIWCRTKMAPSYVTSIVFEQEPEYEENAPDNPEVSRYPLEDLLDKFYCSISDFYEAENESDHLNSYLEFESEDIADIRKLLSIVGKHVYNKENGDMIELVIE